ncbi:DUF2345 domain-containing protein, partial [Cupriavidus taiwanensis]|uniref:DUF2345 domain-containing protein n=1 Tax=Cupriavidus taiwanensis TaxID=164546 RepID=UPI002541547C
VISNALNDITMTATHGAILLNAKAGITLMSGNAGIRIADGCVDVFGPTRVHLNTGDFDVPGPQGISQAMNDWEHTRFNEGFRLVDTADKPLANYAYELVRQDGTLLSGVTDAQGHLAHQKSEIAETLELRILGPAA